MHVCYVDEAGCTGQLPSATSDIQPLFAMLGLILDQSKVQDLTLKFLYLKREFFPNAVLWDNRSPRQFLDWVLFEPKGGDLRKQIAEGGKRGRRQALRFFDKMLSLIEEAGAKLVGRVWVKGISQPFNGHAVYTSSVQRLCEYFDASLVSTGDHGLLVADSRTKDKNAKVSHSVFTGRYSAKMNRYVNLVELPVFGHSENHVGLQMCDLVCSGILFPTAVHTYCAGHVRNVHVRPGYQRIKEQFAERLKKLQYRYLSSDGKWTGGIVCSDAIGQRPGQRLFEL